MLGFFVETSGLKVPFMLNLALSKTPELVFPATAKRTTLPAVKLERFVIAFHSVSNAFIVRQEQSIPGGSVGFGVGLAVGFGIVEVARSEVSPTAFTYQGRLNVRGDSAVGSYDFTFLIFDSPEKGRQIGEPVFCGGVEVADGYFTVELDFGPAPSIFNGLTRYLEISVQRTGLEAPAVLLSPRQKVSATPNARRAFSAQEIRPLKHIGDYVVRMDIEGMSSQYFHHFNWLKSETEIILYNTGPSLETKVTKETFQNVFKLTEFEIKELMFIPAPTEANTAIFPGSKR